MRVLSGWCGSGNPRICSLPRVSPSLQTCRGHGVALGEATADWLCLWPARAARLSCRSPEPLRAQCLSSVYLCALIWHVAPASALSVLVSFLSFSALSGLLGPCSPQLWIFLVHVVQLEKMMQSNTRPKADELLACSGDFLVCYFPLIN